MGYFSFIKVMDNQRTWKLEHLQEKEIPKDEES